jgi:hypothetical protein
MSPRVVRLHPGETLHVIGESEAVTVAMTENHDLQTSYRRMSFGAAEMPRLMAADLFIGIYEHRHGTTVSVHTTEEDAIAAKAQTAREWWHERSDTSAPEDCAGLTDEEVIRAYFDDHPSESYGIYEASLPHTGEAGDINGGQ